jgi:hypothetical protein
MMIATEFADTSESGCRAGTVATDERALRRPAEQRRPVSRALGRGMRRRFAILSSEPDLESLAKHPGSFPLTALPRRPGPRPVER